MGSASSGWRRSALLACSLVAGAAGAADLPPEGRCPGSESASPSGNEIDAIRPRLGSGSVVDRAGLASLRDLLPHEVWEHRDVFFFDGMRLTIGACHRRYAPSPSFAAWSRELTGRSSIDAAGNLRGHRAGLPFAAEAIDAASPDAGARWAWNLERRHRGAGPRGSFLIVDLPDARVLPAHVSVQRCAGWFFFAQLGARADLPGFREPLHRTDVWAAGGEFTEPPDARGIAWRQLRPEASAADERRPDAVFVHLPALRKLRRAAGARVDGVFVPRARVAGTENARVLPYAQGGRVGAIEAGHGAALAVAEDGERGFTGLALRPNAWSWRVVAEREVLAPLNARAGGWPERTDRDYGPSGLSLASDTWDVRLAVVIEGRARDRDVALPRVSYWVDAQTAQPLFVMRRAESGALREVGVLAHRYSGDVARYPTLPSGEPANVFDPVAAAFLELPSGGWRRESWDARSLPLPTEELRALVSTDALVRGR